jgi:lysophospholipase L1-like esterase
LSRGSGLARAILLRVAALAFSFGLALIVVEVGLRLVWTGYYVKTQKAYAHPHPERGWSNRPGVRVPYGEPEFSITVTHDRHGFRSKPVEPERVPGRTRVLVLGDSFAYGVGVEDDQTFSARLEALEPALEVINGGVNGYGTAQELLMLRDEGQRFRPDIVITAFFWNDLGNNNRKDVARFTLDRGQLRYPEPAPARTAEQSAEEEAAVAQAEERRAWLRWSYTYRFASDRGKLLAFWLKDLVGIPLEESDFTSAAEREQAWQLEGALLAEMQRVTRESGARLLLLVIPEQSQVQPDVQVTGLDPEEYQVQERLREIAGREQIPMLDALPALRAAYESRGEPLYYLRDRHLRANGHEIVAAALAAELRSLGWIRSPER